MMRSNSPYYIPEDLPALPPSQSTDYNGSFAEGERGPPQNQPSQQSDSSYYDVSDGQTPLTPHELRQLRRLLNNKNIINNLDDETDADSEYSEFPETTHAWAVFADKPQRKATKMDRFVGTSIILFQLFTYSLFVVEALEDYQKGVVPVLISHQDCDASQEQPADNFQCEAEVTSNFDAVVAFFMLSIFLTPEILQALRAVRAAPRWTSTMVFASLAAIEVISAFVAAAIAISYQLYIGEVTDAIEVGVGLLFVRELSARAYHGIRHKGVKQYKSFAAMLISLIAGGLLVEATCEYYAKRMLDGEDLF